MQELDYCNTRYILYEDKANLTRASSGVTTMQTRERISATKETSLQTDSRACVK
jgi:hypothetical protein